MAKSFHYGGQAVLEGVMMRGEKHYAIAVRQETGEIATTVKGLSDMFGGKLRRIPLIRGIVVLIETLIIGTRALIYSADVAMGEEEIKGKSGLLWGSLIFGIILAVGLFVAIPLLVTRFAIDPYVSSSVLSNVANGLVRLIIIIGYLWLIGYMPDIRRVFSYHGAEHKTINAYENGVPLEVQQVKNYSTAHTRCGTSFLLIVLFLAIIIYIFIGRPVWYLRFAYQLALLPVIAAISYELLRLSARFHDSIVVRILTAPGMLIQRLTTREPDDKQLEVGIVSLQTVLDAESEDERGDPDV